MRAKQIYEQGGEQTFALVFDTGRGHLGAHMVR